MFRVKNGDLGFRVLGVKTLEFMVCGFEVPSSEFHGSGCQGFRV